MDVGWGREGGGCLVVRGESWSQGSQGHIEIIIQISHITECEVVESDCPN